MLRKVVAIASAAALIGGLSLLSSAGAPFASAASPSPVLRVDGQVVSTTTVSDTGLTVTTASGSAHAGANPDNTCPSTDYCEAVTMPSTTPNTIVVYSPGWDIGSTSGDCGSESFTYSPTSQKIYPVLYNTDTGAYTVGTTALSSGGTAEFCPYPTEDLYELGYYTAKANTQSVSGQGELIYGTDQ